MEFQAIKVSIDDLLLDVRNPRFIIPQGSSQIDLIKYLIEYEEIPQLANGINLSKGLSPGERIIICKDSDKYIVLEGNRRVCACKLLIDRKLIPDWKRSAIEQVDEETKSNILLLNTDLVTSREEIQGVLYRRHINGVKDWAPISKLKFTAAEYDNGMTIEDISSLVADKPGKVKSDLRDYKLIMFALSLKEWDKYGIGRPDIQKIKFTYFTHALETRWDGESIETGFSLLQMRCDENTKFEVLSTLPEDVFQHAIFLLAKAAFFDKSINTRSHIKDVADLVDYLIECNIIHNKLNEQKFDETDLSSSSDNTLKTSTQGPNEQPQDIDAPKPINSSGQSSNTGWQATTPKATAFFENLTWSSLNPAISEEHSGLCAMAKELRTISERNYYGNCPIATAMLLRSLLEQSIKYYIKKKNEWDNAIAYINNRNRTPKPAGYDPMLNELIGFLRSNNKYQSIFIDRTIQSAYTNATTPEMQDFLNTNIHNTHILRATKSDLERRAISGGLFSLINFILNDK